MSIQKKKKLPASQKALDLLAQVESQTAKPVKPMGRSERSALSSQARSVPLAAIDKCLALVESHKGELLGVPVDVAQARSDLADSATLRSIAATARRIARNATDAALEKTATIAQTVVALEAALKAVSKTVPGASLRQQYDDLRAERPRSRRARKATAPVTPGPKPAQDAAAPVTVSVPVGSSATVVNGASAKS